MALMACTIAKPIRCVKEIFPPRARLRWLLMTMRLSNSSFTGTARTDVAVGSSSEAFMFLTTAADGPRSVTYSGPSGEAAGSALRAGSAAGAGALAGAGAAAAGFGATGAGAGAGAGAAGAAWAGAGGAAGAAGAAGVVVVAAAPAAAVPAGAEGAAAPGL
ncbi:hypothetical protein RKD18_005509 [Streptomyces phaeoluteigriseus]